MRKALIVGIDYYENIKSLNGAVNDAHSVKTTLERNADGTRNFAQPNLMTSTGPGSDVTRAELREAIEQLFRDDADIALLYFSGHGHIDGIGGYLCASDFATEHDGLSFADIMGYANQSPAKNKVIILDSCHSGAAGGSAISAKVAEVSEGVTILTASAANQYAMETGGSGVFTSLLVDARSGAAANLVGDVTPGSVYAHVDQSLGPWSQRPIFKTNVKEFVSLRKADAQSSSRSCTSSSSCSRNPQPSFSWIRATSPSAPGPRTLRSPGRIRSRPQTLPSCRRWCGSTWYARWARRTCGTRPWSPRRAC